MEEIYKKSHYVEHNGNVNTTKYTRSTKFPNFAAKQLRTKKQFNNDL